MKKMIFSFGRMNPPTIGHEKLANKIKDVAKKEKADARLYLSHTQNSKKDPLTYNDKIRYAKNAFGIAHKSRARNIFDILPELEKEGYTDVIMVVGSDRVGEFTNLINKYNGKDYNFDSIKVVSAGERDPDAEGVEGMSGSKLRQLAVQGDQKTFKSGLASKLSDADKTKIYNTLRKTLKEDMENFDDLELDELVEILCDEEFTDEVLAELEEFLEEAERPAKYYSGDMSKSTKDKRAAQFAKQADMDDDNPAAYKPAPGDATAKTKPSKHTKKYKQMFGEASDETMIQMDEKIDGLVKKAEKSGMPYGILKKVYDRGIAAWRTGHRPGTTPQQWAFARVNSFVTKSSGTWGKADADLAAKVRGSKSESVDEALTVSQRLKRARLMKRLAPKIARARNIRKKRMADATRLLKRSRKQAKNVLRKKFAGKSGENYANLSYSQKMTVDKLVDKHSAKIEKLAKRLLPKIRKAEIARVQAARSSKNESIIVESTVQMEKNTKRFKELFNEARKSSEESENILMGLRKAVSLKGKDIQFDNGKKAKVTDSEARTVLAKFDDLRTTQEKQVYLKKLSGSPASFKAALTDKNPGKGEPKRGISLGGKYRANEEKMTFKNIIEKKDDSVNFSLTETAEAAIIKKAEKSGISVEVLKEVYNRGIESYVEGNNTKQQFAFNRVNSFISGGKTTTNADADLWNEAYGDGVRSTRSRSADMDDRKFFKAITKGTKPMRLDPDEVKRNQSNSRLKGYGQGKIFKKEEEQNEGIYKSPAHARLQKQMDKIYKTSKYKDDVRKLGGTPEKPGSQNMFVRTKKEAVSEEGGAGEWGTDALTNKYKSDTPGQGEDAGLNELGKSPLDRLLDRLRIKPKMNVAVRHFLKYKKENPTVDDRTAAVRVAQDMGLPLRTGTEFLLKALNDLKLIQTEEVDTCCDDCNEYYDHEITEAEYEGRKVELNNPFRLPTGSKKKFGVYAKNEKGNVVKVTFGDPNMEIKRDDPGRRASFRARHGCDKDPGPKWKAKYWSCWQWRANAKVDN